MVAPYLVSSNGYSYCKRHLDEHCEVPKCHNMVDGFPKIRSTFCSTHFQQEVEEFGWPDKIPEGSCIVLFSNPIDCEDDHILEIYSSQILTHRTGGNNGFNICQIHGCTNMQWSDNPLECCNLNFCYLHYTIHQDRAKQTPCLQGHHVSLTLARLGSAAN